MPAIKVPKKDRPKKKLIMLETCPVCGGRGTYQSGGQPVCCHGCRGRKVVAANIEMEKHLKKTR